MEKEKEEIATDLKFPATAEIKIPWQKEIERKYRLYLLVVRALVPLFFRTRASLLHARTNAGHKKIFPARALNFSRLCVTNLTPRVVESRKFYIAAIPAK